MAARHLEGAVVVVTGAGSGIGATTALRDPGVVMVGVEGHLGHHGRYLLPRPIQERLARICP
jgi:hypothetical protein